MTTLLRLRHRLEALEARADAVKRKCKTGYSCGSTCISVKKECRSDPQGGLSKERAERLMALAKGEIKPRGIGALKPEQAGQLAMEINKFQRTGVKPPWYVEPAAQAAADDELDVSTPEARLAFLKRIRGRSMARPGASFDGNTLAAATLRLCDQPGEVGRNARRMAKFLHDSNVLTVVDDLHPNQRRGAKADGPIKEADIKHLLKKEVIEKVAVNWPTVNRIADNIKYNQQQIKFSRQAIKNIEVGMEEDNRMGWTTPASEARNHERIKYHRDTMAYAKEGLQISFRTLATSLMGKAGAWGLANRTGVLRMLDEPDGTPWDSRGLDPAALTRDSAQMVERYGRPGFTAAASTTSGSKRSRNGQIMSVFIHELGHMVHYASGDARNTIAKLPPELEGNIREADPINLLSSLVGDTRHFVSDYATTNRMELFAESFEAFVTAPEALRNRSPEVYRWVDDTLRRAQATPVVAQG